MLWRYAVTSLRRDFSFHWRSRAQGCVGNVIFRLLRPRWCVLSPKEVNYASSRFSGLRRAFKAIFWNELYPKDIKLVGSRATDWDFSWFIRQGECIPIEIWIGWARAPFLWLNWGRCATVLQCYSATVVFKLVNISKYAHNIYIFIYI